MRVIIAIIFPPLAVLSTRRIGAFLLNLLLCLLFWIPAIIHAIYVVLDYKAEKRMQRQASLLAAAMASRPTAGPSVAPASPQLAGPTGGRRVNLITFSCVSVAGTIAFLVVIGAIFSITDGSKTSASYVPAAASKPTTSTAATETGQSANVQQETPSVAPPAKEDNQKELPNTAASGTSASGEPTPAVKNEGNIYTLREWTSADGTRTFNGQLKEVLGERFTILKDGVPFTVTADKLSEADREFLAQRITFTTADGQQFEDVALHRLQPASAEFKTTSGIQIIDAENLPVGLKRRFGYELDAEAIATLPETLVVNGKQYTHLKVTRVDPAGVQVSHSSGMTRFLFTDLPEEIQKVFNYDPERAKRFEEERRAQLYEQRRIEQAAMAAMQDHAPSTATASVRVSRAEFGDDWPFTVAEGVIGYEPLGGALCILTFTSGGTTYALNGLAKGKRGYKDIEAIWRPEPTNPELRINISPIINRGLALGR